MKRIIVLLLSILVLNISVYASSEITVRTDTKSAKPGETVEINIDIENNTGILAMKFQLTYDSQRLKLLKAEDKGLIGGAVFSQTADKYPYVMLWNSASNKNFSENGTLATLTFEVKENAQSGLAFINLSYDTDDVYDVSLNPVSLGVVNGGVHIIGADKSDNTNVQSNNRGTFGNKTVTKKNEAVDKEKNQIILTIDKKEAKVFGKTIVNDVAPKIVNDRTMLPIRFIAESLGAAVAWIEETQKVEITKEGLKIDIYIGSDKAFVNNNEVMLDCSAFVENDRTYLPLRFISEKLGANVEWDEVYQRVIITAQD